MIQLNCIRFDFIYCVKTILFIIIIIIIVSMLYLYCILALSAVHISIQFYRFIDEYVGLLIYTHTSTFSDQLIAQQKYMFKFIEKWSRSVVCCRSIFKLILRRKLNLGNSEFNPIEAAKNDFSYFHTELVQRPYIARSVHCTTIECEYKRTCGILCEWIYVTGKKKILFEIIISDERLNSTARSISKCHVPVIIVIVIIIVVIMNTYFIVIFIQYFFFFSCFIDTMELCVCVGGDLFQLNLNEFSFSFL